MTENLDLLGFDDVASSRPTIQDGEYHLRVVGPKLETSKDGGKYIQYDAIVQSGPNAGYRIFRAIFSLKADKVWQFKRDTKAAAFEIPGGLTITEAGEYFAANGNGLEIVARVGSRPLTVDDGNGNYVPDPEGGRENTVRRWLSAA